MKEVGEIPSFLERVRESFIFIMRRRVNCQAKSEMAASEQQQKDDREPGEPAHHARRPMNAFLIFCKRHRTSVRSHFPNLENRAVTRVLGEWWATLHPEQKQSYVDLAQEYKDAFLNANPDFKWYKLPAPPLRTLTTRPTNKKQEYDVTTENSNYTSTETTVSKNQAIQPGKLADETQIGGLSSLFTPQKQKEPGEDGQLDGTTVPKPPKKRYTELSNDSEPKRDCKADLFSNNFNRTESNNNNNEEHRLNQEASKNLCLDEIDESAYRGERSCKGVRYQKFLAEQQRTLGTTGQTTKRRKLNIDSGKSDGKERRNSISSNVSEKTDSLSSEGGTRSDLEHFVDSAEGRVEASKPEDTETEGAELGKEYVWTVRKRFKAEDFNLEKKIEALPSLSLEEFQEKKKQQRTKKKKIQQKVPINSTKRQNYDQLNNNNNNRVNERQELLLVGSQKRKARKQSITRNAGAHSNEQNDKDGNQPWCASPDLEALACLAELAANRTKLTK